ncbi:UDP-N-acetylglucosamine--N-acetylmuramyl-(pentapeptide) pyrophosphoryl-undecaprenol N-acetylglucosamine transferase [Verrucomicrobiota bacterium]|jgi:UDP-N-acetylglucosamine--N-acetylmuramyl-(pentapeptide) pyrophosphoryl-undecaprenol N-acetylglucosamine transferase|nr:UDP-N-acetylglucosamine--N-acetylmuramyl-(pentapeptide) pyrophosphoryl-undecaprenol N-acetylglucosamine transferase [Verrucomicrobiota bacterium]
MNRVLLACGGTGGHLAPGIALAQRLTDEGHECLLIVSSKAVDARMTANYPRLRFVPGQGRGFGPGFLAKLRFFPALLGAVWSARTLLRAFKPDALVCFGGFMSVGPALAARLGGIPVLVHEANRRPGKAVRLIARFAQSIHLPAGVRLAGLPAGRQHDSGYPVRAEMRPLAKELARRTLGFPSTGRLLLFTGGSQGAASLNRWVESHLDELAARGIHALCLTGPGGRDERVERAGVVIHFLPFCHQMATAYSAADLAVTRAGAGTLAELATCRTAAILVPFPHAADDHQTANALQAAESGAAILLPERELGRLGEVAFGCLADNAALAAMRDALALADAANHWEELARETIELAQARARRVALA